jgi:hypothetical protein
MKTKNKKKKERERKEKRAHVLPHILHTFIASISSARLTSDTYPCN